MMEFSLIPVAHAQTVPGIADKIVSLLSGSVIPIIFGIATIVFLWGVVQFITAGGNEEKRKEGRKFIIYGLVGLFVMVAVWGIVNVLIGFLGLDVRPPSFPGFPGS